MRGGFQMLIGAIAAAWFGLTMPAIAQTTANDVPVLLNSKFILSPPELDRLQAEALQGSGESAIRV